MAMKRLPQVKKDFVNPKLDYVGLHDVKLWEDNPRRNDQAVSKLAREIILHGQRAPIIVWRENSTVYKGNTTLKALRYVTELSASEWDEFIKPIVLAQRKLGALEQQKFHRPSQVLVMYVDFPSEEAAIAFGIADNKASEWSEWDEDKLGETLESLRDILEDDGSLAILESLTAFSSQELHSLTLTPDLKKIQSKVQKGTGLAGVVKLTCGAEDREELIAWLQEEVPDAGFKNVEIN